MGVRHVERTAGVIRACRIGNVRSSKAGANYCRIAASAASCSGRRVSRISNGGAVTDWSGRASPTITFSSSKAGKSAARRKAAGAALAPGSASKSSPGCRIEGHGRVTDNFLSFEVGPSKHGVGSTVVGEAGNNHRSYGDARMRKREPQRQDTAGPVRVESRRLGGNRSTAAALSPSSVRTNPRAKQKTQLHESNVRASPLSETRSRVCHEVDPEESHRLGDVCQRNPVFE